MKIEYLFIIILIPILLNIYYDGKILTLLNKFNIKQYEKYYKMAIIIFIFFCIYIFIKKNPNNKKDFFKSASNYVKYLPVDKNTTAMLQPFLNMASNYNDNTYSNNNYNNLTPQQSKILTSGGRSNKRSVSETKKKYVASQQNWKCKHCKCQLPAWFEVDHVKKLEYGGSNSIDNLEALCRNCHGKKTAFENL
jgi:hypothetical protein